MIERTSICESMWYKNVKFYNNFIPDSIYTERYMGLPTKQDNLDAYEATRLTTHPEKFRGKNFLLIHGTFDDNVHFQQSLHLARSLEINDIPFEQQVCITYIRLCNQFKK